MHGDKLYFEEFERDLVNKAGPGVGLYNYQESYKQILRKPIEVSFTKV
jgi:hypothetical protein